jgi:hypothetical protein
MALQREGDLAWGLVEQYRDLLTTEECCAVFVDLGVGDYPVTIRGVLSAVGAQRRTLTQRAAADVRAWIDCYQMEAEFGDVLMGATRASQGA